MESWTAFYEQIWSQSFWLPEGISWQDMKPTPEINMPDSDDLWTYPIIIGICILLFRVFVFIKIFHALGKRLGLSDVPISEMKKNEFRKGEAKSLLKNPQPNVLKNKTSSGPSLCDKFCTASFSLCFRTLLSIMGLFVFYNEPWVFNIRGCWQDFPYHSLSTGHWWYYIIGLSLYWSLLIWDFVNPPSKGKIAFYLHHTFTTSIIIFSWMVNLTRVGSLIFFLHDSCDIFLEATKICLYFKLDIGVDIFYTICLISWIGFRIILFGGVIIRSAYFEAYEYNFMPSAYLFFMLLFALLALNVLWSCMFFIAGYKRITTGKYRPTKDDEDKLKKGDKMKNGSYSITLIDNGKIKLY